MQAGVVLGFRLALSLPFRVHGGQAKLTVFVVAPYKNLTICVERHHVVCAGSKLDNRCRVKFVLVGRGEVDHIDAILAPRERACLPAQTRGGRAPTENHSAGGQHEAVQLSECNLGHEVLRRSSIVVVGFPITLQATLGLAHLGQIRAADFDLAGAPVAGPRQVQLLQVLLCLPVVAVLIYAVEDLVLGAFALLHGVFCLRRRDDVLVLIGERHKSSFSAHLLICLSK